MLLGTKVTSSPIYWHGYSAEWNFKEHESCVLIITPCLRTHCWSTSLPELGSVNVGQTYVIGAEGHPDPLYQHSFSHQNYFTPFQVASFTFFSQFQSVSPGWLYSELSSIGAQVCIINRLYKEQGGVVGVRTETPSPERDTIHSLDPPIQQAPPPQKKARFLTSRPIHVLFSSPLATQAVKGRQFFALIVTRLFALGVTFCLWVLLMGCK